MHVRLSDIKIRVTGSMSDIRVWYLQQSLEPLHAFNQMNHQDIPRLLYSVAF